MLRACQLRYVYLFLKTIIQRLGCEVDSYQSVHPAVAPFCPMQTAILPPHLSP